MSQGDFGWLLNRQCHGLALKLVTNTCIAHIQALKNEMALGIVDLLRIIFNISQLDEINVWLSLSFHLRVYRYVLKHDFTAFLIALWIIFDNFENNI